MCIEAPYGWAGTRSSRSLLQRSFYCLLQLQLPVLQAYTQRTSQTSSSIGSGLQNSNVCRREYLEAASLEQSCARVSCCGGIGTQPYATPASTEHAAHHKPLELTCGAGPHPNPPPCPQCTPPYPPTNPQLFSVCIEPLSAALSPHPQVTFPGRLPTKYHALCLRVRSLSLCSCTKNLDCVPAVLPRWGLAAEVSMNTKYRHFPLKALWRLCLWLYPAVSTVYCWLWTSQKHSLHSASNAAAQSASDI